MWGGWVFILDTTSEVDNYGNWHAHGDKSGIEIANISSITSVYFKLIGISDTNVAVRVSSYNKY